MYATDGHRLHTAATILADGSYHPLTGAPAVKECGAFPIADVMRMVETNAGDTELDFILADADIIQVAEVGTVYKLADGVGILTDYLDSALNGAPTAVMLSGDDLAPTTFRMGSRTAIIAPVRLKK